MYRKYFVDKLLVANVTRFLKNFISVTAVDGSFWFIIKKYVKTVVRDIEVTNLLLLQTSLQVCLMNQLG